MEKIKYIVIEQLLNEGRKEDAMKKFPAVPAQIVDIFSQADPSGNNKYLDWMVSQINTFIVNLIQSGDITAVDTPESLEKALSNPVFNSLSEFCL